MPSFEHAFAPSPTALSSSVDLTAREVEDAGLREILQMPGAAIGSWKILDALLDPGVPSFSFLQPLGHAREVKTAVSGLFGRFVARAYATRYLGLTKFVHIRRPPMRLSGAMRGELRRVRGKRGDLPDWVAWGPSAGLAIVEAKGCHDSKGPQAALRRAYRQAERAEIVTGSGTLAPFKRYAIATRWGFTSPKLTRPMLWVHDPEIDGSLTAEELTQLEVGMTRWHLATLLAPLGYDSLARSVLELTQSPFRNRREQAERVARAALHDASTYRVESPVDSPGDDLIGGFVTRGGPLAATSLTESEQATLRKYDLRPAFVGVERGALDRAINGVAIERPAADGKSVIRRRGEDGGGSWVIRADEDEVRIIPRGR